MQFYPLEKLINLEDGYRRAFQIDAHHLLLLQIDGDLHLLESHCPHRAQPLLLAQLVGDRLRCPAHGYEFSLIDGRVLRAGEEPCRALRRYEVVYRDADVGVML